MTPKHPSSDKKSQKDSTSPQKANLLVENTSSHLLQTRYYGTLHAFGFKYIPTNDEILTLVFGDPHTVEFPLVRIHSRCLTGDVFGSAHCECGQQLEMSLLKMQAEGVGIFIYLEQEGRGSGLVAKLKAYELNEKEGLDTVDAYHRLNLPIDNRSYDAAIQILKFFEINRIRLLTNNPDKIDPIVEAGIQVQRESIEIPPTQWDIDYLKTKKQRMGHLLSKL